MNSREGNQCSTRDDTPIIMTKRIIPLPEKISIASLSRWVDKCLQEGVPRGIISFTLLSHTNQVFNLEQLESLSAVENNISTIMVNRNLNGIEFEKAGHFEEAIFLYEQNVADWFEGDHPYNRLRVIYINRKQLKDAIRVCDAFINVADELIALGSPRADLPLKREKFLEWAKKLREKDAQAR